MKNMVNEVSDGRDVEENCIEAVHRKTRCVIKAHK